MENYLPLPDLSSLISNDLPQHALLKDMEYLAEEMYDVLGKLEEIPDQLRMDMMADFLKDLKRYKETPSDFQQWLQAYENRTKAEARRKAKLKIPEVITDIKRIDQMFTMAEYVKKNLLEMKYPTYLRMTIENCMKLIKRDLKRGSINCTRDMWRSMKMVRLGTEKENERDARFFVLLGVSNLKKALREELNRARLKNK